MPTEGRCYCLPFRPRHVVPWREPPYGSRAGTRGSAPDSGVRSPSLADERERRRTTRRTGGCVRIRGCPRVGRGPVGGRRGAAFARPPPSRRLDRRCARARCVPPRRLPRACGAPRLHSRRPDRRSFFAQSASIPRYAKGLDPRFPSSIACGPLQWVARPLPELVDRPVTARGLLTGAGARVVFRPED